MDVETSLVLLKIISHSRLLHTANCLQTSSCDKNLMLAVQLTHITRRRAEMISRKVKEQ